jgi:hypothetical protein
MNDRERLMCAAGGEEVSAVEIGSMYRVPIFAIIVRSSFEVLSMRCFSWTLFVLTNCLFLIGCARYPSTNPSREGKTEAQITKKTPSLNEEATWRYWQDLYSINQKLIETGKKELNNSSLKTLSDPNYKPSSADEASKLLKELIATQERCAKAMGGFASEIDALPLLNVDFEARRYATEVIEYTQE